MISYLVMNVKSFIFSLDATWFDSGFYKKVL